MSEPEAPPTRATGLRVVFAGTPLFARRALEAVAASSHPVVGVLTQPDRPAGRGMRLQASEVKAFAASRGWPLCQPRGLRLDGKVPAEAAAARDWLRTLQPDVMVVAAYGLILPPWALQLPRLGCLNIHASLLPRWRGAAPIQRALEAGDAVTGVTIMQMDAGLDTGDMLLAEAVPIAPDDTASTLHDRLAALGATLIVQALDLAEAGRLRPLPQPVEGVTHAAKIDKREASIDWSEDARVLERRVRAFDPFPGAVTATPQGESLKVWRSTAIAPSALPVSASGVAPPGTLLAAGPQGIDVACGRGVLRLLTVQRAGGRRLPVAEFLAGHPLAVGAVLRAAEPS